MTFGIAGDARAYSGLALGTHTFEVKAIDGAGNADGSPASYSWMVDAPVAPVDNPKPSLVSSTPADGTTVASASSIALVADEALAGIRNATLDGGPAFPTILGENASFATGPLDPGPHTLAGELEDLAGQRKAFRIHFTVWSGPSDDYPYVEKNMALASATTIESSNGLVSVTVPAWAWSPSGDDWVVVRLDLARKPSVGNGYEAARDVLELSAHWALSGAPVTRFALPADLDLGSDIVQGIPTVREGTTWRPLPLLTSANLPEGQNDGFYRSGSELHALALQTGSYAVLRDVQAPSTPGSFTGTVSGKTLTLKWSAATDNSGQIGGYVVYAGGKAIASVGAVERSAGISSFSAKDSRTFTVAAKDAAGNVGTRTKALAAVPALRGVSPNRAKTLLAARGFKAGSTQKEFSSVVRKGLVIRAKGSGVARVGSSVPLVVSTGPRAGASRPWLVLDVTNATATAEAARDLLRVNIFLSRPADTSVRLLDSNGRRLLTWDRGLEAGSTAVEMRVPAGVLAAGTYKVLVSAVGPDGSTVTDTVVINVPSRDEDDSPTATSSGSAPIPPDAPFSNGPTGGESEPAAGRGDEASSPRRAEVHSALPAAANPRVQPFQPQKVIAGTVPGGQADEAMPMRKSLGLVLLIVAAASVFLSAFLKGGALLALVGRRPL